MFNSRPLSGAAGDIWRYLTGHERGIEEYYLGRGEAAGEVFGKGAERLGLDSIDRARSPTWPRDCPPTDPTS